MNIIAELIDRFDPERPNFRPTEIYKENWLLKAFLHHASSARLEGSPLEFSVGADWFSEARLPTAFAARARGDPLAESRTNADGVIGHFTVGSHGAADLELKPDATQFTVIEAKLGSPLSAGTTNAPGFDQAARNVACMAETLHRADLPPEKMDTLAFIVIAPESSIEAGTFASEMDREGMKAKTHDRAAAYEGALDDWYERWAGPTLAAIGLFTLSWERAIDALRFKSPAEAAALSEFYDDCLRFDPRV